MEIMRGSMRIEHRPFFFYLAEIIKKTKKWEGM